MQISISKLLYCGLSILFSFIYLYRLNNIPKHPQHSKHNQYIHCTLKFESLIQKNKKIKKNNRKIKKKKKLTKKNIKKIMYGKNETKKKKKKLKKKLKNVRTFFVRVAF